MDPGRPGFLLGTLSVVMTPPTVVLALRLVQRRRRPGVVVGRHYIASVDVIRSLLYSVRGAKRHELLLLVLFLVALTQRRRLTELALPHFKGLASSVGEQWARHFMRRRSSWMTFGGVLWFAHWRRSVCERPLVSCQRTFWNVAVVEKAGFAKREFRPVFWLTSRHAQTVLAHVIADSAFLVLPPVQWRREAVATHDGGEIHLDWVASQSRDSFEPYGDGLTVSDRTSSADYHDHVSDAEPIILLMYGIGGTRDDHYIKHLATSCRARGWRPVVLSYWRLDWNEWRDVDAAVTRISATYPFAPLFAVAHSASAYILVQYLARVGDRTPIVAATSVSGCMDFLRAYDFVKHTKNRTYRGVFERGMRRCVRRHHAHDPTLSPDQRQQRAARLLKIRVGADVMYDRHVASLNNATHLSTLFHAAGNDHDDDDPAFLPPKKRRGSRSSSHNTPATHPSTHHGAPPKPSYVRSRTVALLERTQPHYKTPARVLLSHVEVPLLLLHARDDPLVSHDDNYDWSEAIKNPRIVTVRTNRGGHCGWHEGFWPIGPSFAVSVVTDYVSAVLEQTHQTGWLCAVFDSLQTRASPNASELAASKIAHAAASQNRVVPLAEHHSTTSFNAFHSFLFEHDDGRSSRADSLAGDAPSATDDLPGDLDDELNDGLQDDEDGVDDNFLLEEDEDDGDDPAFGLILD